LWQIHEQPGPKEEYELKRKCERSGQVFLPRKASKGVYQVPVPQTDTGRLGEYPKARERTLAKELGNLTP
jgi:hypothetical protein